MPNIAVADSIPQLQAQLEELRVTGAAHSCKNLGVLGLPLTRSLILVGLASTTLGNVCSAAESDAGNNVLVIYSFSERSIFDSVYSLESAVRVRCGCQVNFFVEYLEAPRFEDPEFEKASAETLQRKLANVKLDLIITAAYPALNFVLAYRDQLFPDVPIVFSYLAPGRIIGVNAPVASCTFRKLSVSVEVRSNFLAMVSRSARSDWR